nr:uncharacterized protein LOC128671789 [Plodia interpunctella]
MFQFYLTSLVAITLIVGSLASPTSSPIGKDLNIVGLENAEYEMADLKPSHHTKRTGEFGTVLLAIKDQFREIIEDLLFQGFAYCKIHLQQFKVNLLRKLGMYTLSDVFHIIFDGVNDFVGIAASPAPASADEEYSDDKVMVTPDFGYSDPYSLAALLAAKRDQ